jgi:ELWxxDGT repeat protein
VLVLLALADLPASAAEPAAPTLVRDVRPGQDGQLDTPLYIFTWGGEVYFPRTSPLTGEELWRTDGTPEGTTLVRDLLPGVVAPPTPINGNEQWGVYAYTEMGDALYLVTRRGAQGWELLRKERGSVDTVRLLWRPRVNLFSDDPDPFIQELLPVGGTLYFTATPRGGDAELWKTDGTPAGTLRVKDVLPGPTGSAPHAKAAVGGTLYFLAKDTPSGTPALWKSDGTEAGTVKVWSPPSGSTPRATLGAGGTLFFYVEHVTSSGMTPQLWKSDGTPAGTAKVMDLPYSPGPPPMVELGGRLLLGLSSGLWATDGTPAGTLLLRDVAIRHDLLSTPARLGGQLFFVGAESEHGWELWKTDGTPAGTVRVTDLRPGPEDGALDGVATLNGAVYFMGRDTASAVQLWKTDGTPEGTAKVAELPPLDTGFSLPRYLMVASPASGRLLFCLRDATPMERDKGLWTSDGTATGTRRLMASRPEPRGSAAQNVTRVGTRVFFTAEDGEHGRELWTSDGTSAGTVRLTDIHPGAASTTFLHWPEEPLVVRGDSVFFLALDATGKEGLWRSDGTAAGTVLVKALGPHLLNMRQRLALLGNTLLFAGFDNQFGHELWKSDGTTAGTVLVKDINPGANGSSPTDLVVVGNRVFFGAWESSTGHELWTSDGTAAGTRLVKDISPGSFSSRFPHSYFAPAYAVLGGTLYFAAEDDTHGWELWKTDGTAAGTVMVKDIHPGPQGSIDTLVALGGRLYLRAHTEAQGLEPWTSDGTTAGTVLLKDVMPGPGSGYGTSFTQVGDAVVFFAMDEAHGMELWRTAGTPGSTALLADLWPGTESSIPLIDPMVPRAPELVAVEEAGLAFFAAADAAGGLELWRTDGTRTGTQRVVDLMPGHEPSSPSGLTSLGEALFFAAADATSGHEPRLLAVPKPPPPPPPPADTTPPTLTCPAAVTSETAEPSGMRVYYVAARASDEGGTVVLRYSHFSGALYPLGTTVVTVTATDTAGNASQCTFEVTVKPKATEPAPEEPAPEEPEPEVNGGGCASVPGAPGAAALWGLLALLAGASARRRR